MIDMLGFQFIHFLYNHQILINKHSTNYLDAKPKLQMHFLCSNVYIWKIWWARITMWVEKSRNFPCASFIMFLLGVTDKSWWQEALGYLHEQINLHVYLIGLSCILKVPDTDLYFVNQCCIFSSHKKEICLGRKIRLLFLIFSRRPFPLPSYSSSSSSFSAPSLLWEKWGSSKQAKK